MNVREDGRYESYLISSLNILKENLGCVNLKFRCTGRIYMLITAFVISDS
jgi:hypothetical protein